MAKKKVDTPNPIVDALEWVLMGSAGLPRALGFRYDSMHSAMVIKYLECSRSVKEVYLKGRVDLKHMIHEIGGDIEVIKSEGGIEQARSSDNER